MNETLKKIKMCFISTYIGPLKLLEISDNFKKIEGANYYFFTNLKKEEVNSECWDVIEINIDDFKNINSTIKISRYFKFQCHKYLKNNLNIDPEFIFYCDSYLYPREDVKWGKICKILKKQDTSIVQYLHPSNKGKGINKDFSRIIKFKKETEDNINKTKRFFNKINPNVNLNSPQYFENTVFGLYLHNKNCIKQLNTFWKYYLRCPTFRDQPLWNFMYLRNNIKPYIDPKLKSYFLGKNSRKLDRTIQEYKDSNKIL